MLSTSFFASFFNASNRKTLFSSMKTTSGNVIPVATTTMSVILNGNNKSTCLVQFRGKDNIERLATYIKALDNVLNGGEKPFYNGLHIHAHLGTYLIPTDTEKFTYADVLTACDALEVKSYSGLTTTVFVVDSFDPTFVLNSESVKKALTESGVNNELKVSPQLVGLLQLDNSVKTDGPKYVFGQSNSNANPEKFRYSVAGIAINGSDSAKVRVERHGQQYLEAFKRAVGRYSHMIITGNLVIYNDTNPLVINIGVWVNAYTSLNIGTLESGNLSMLMNLIDDNSEVVVEPEIVDSSTLYSNAGANAQVFGTTQASVFDKTTDLPF